MSVHSLKSVQVIPAAAPAVWRFFSDPRNLLAITPPFLHLKMTNEMVDETVYAGQLITYHVRPLLGIPLTWVTQITQLVEEKFFVDEQLRGPYALWHHQHLFRPLNEGIEMTDIVHYALPFGPLSNLATRPVRKKLREIFLYRQQRIAERFGSVAGRAPLLWL